MKTPRVAQVGPGLHLVSGTNVNWAMVTEGDAVTLVDTGYPHDLGALLAGLDGIGRRPQDVVAVLITHAHLDHVGALPGFLAVHRAPVFTGPAEVAHLRGEYTEQITPAAMLGLTRRRAGRRWVRQTLRAVLPHLSVQVSAAQPATYGEPLDVPGRLVPIPATGHTTGHTAWQVPDAGALLTGDALVSAHPVSRLPDGPQILPPVFNHDEADLMAGLRGLRSLPVDLVLPGHGPVLHGDIATLIDRALETAERR